MIKKCIFLPLALLVLALPAYAAAQPCAEDAPYSEQDAQSLLSAFVSYTDLRIRSVQRSLEILASTTEARSGNWLRMEAMLRGYEKSETGLVAWYALADGSYFIVDQGLMEQGLGDRSYFPDLMAGRTVTGALVISRSTGQRSAVIAVPVTRDGQVVGAVGVSLFLDRLAEQIDAALAPRPDVAFFALAPDGLTTLHRKQDRHFLDPRELGSETLRQAAMEMLSETSGKTHYAFDNAQRHAIYRTSELTHWRFAIAYDAAPQE